MPAQLPLRFISFGLLVSLALTLVAIGLLVIAPEETAEPTPTLVAIVPAPLLVMTEPPTVTLTPVPSITPVPASATPQATLILISATPSLTATALPVATDSCPPPEGWVSHMVAAGETLFAFQLGSGNTVTVDQILQANCLTERFIFEGQLLWLPPGAAENAPSSESVPTAIVADPNAPPPPQGLTRSPRCPCEITIRPGWRLEQIAEVIDSLPVGFYGRDFMAVAGRGAALPTYDFLSGASSLEGYMLPGTYTITNEMTALAFRDLVVGAFAAATGELWGAAANGLTPYQTVTLASIIIRESGSYEQQVLISSVFHNRLKSGRALGATVTTQYALGRAGDWWPNVQGRISTLQSPYNTNLNVGLPPTPIASPTLDALRAAAQPAQTNYLFFTGNCQGTGNVFAETYDQHLANVQC